VAILTSWSVDVVPNTAAERQLASELIVFLISNLNNERQDIFKYHLELIRLLIEAWKTSVVVPHDLIYSKLNVEPTSRKVEIGIHLSSIFLANKITPWKDNWTEFCKTLFSIVMKSKHRSTYKPCAETIGLLLRHASNEPSFSKVFGNVQVLLKKINDPDKYALVLEALVVHFPRIADEFNLNLILSRIHGVSKPLKMIYMRIILSQSDKMSSISDFKMERWDAYIENDNFEVQLLALEIVHNCLNVLKDCSFYKSIIESVCKHVSNSNLLCRSRMFDIAIKICQNRDSANEEVELCKTVLVQGLTDGDTEIREKVYDFWRNESTLPNHISARLPYILSNLYEASTENDFLGYSSYLLLDIIKTTEQYNSLLFEHPLEDCDFENYDLQTNWRARHLSVVPLFAETVRSSSQHFSVFSETDPNKLRQTQTSREFAITQTARMQQLSQITMSESSLFVKTRDDNTFLNPNLVTLSQKYLVPKRRFLRNANKIRSHFANQEVKKSQDKIKQRIDSAKERENKVTIFRNYRKGDLPDVQITLQSVLEPLQNITLHDGEISKILYSEIFKSTLLKMRSDQSFVEQVSTSINSIFNSSVHFYRNLFQTLFEVLILSKNEIVLSPDLVATVCHSCGLRTLGILLLEEYIISHGEELSDAKKARGFQNNSEINIWVKMAELYKEMEEWDAVKSIFLEKNDCPGNVKDALAAESRKQWKDAQDLYKNLIESDESLERKDFYYESYFKCFSHLGEWTNLVGSIEGIVSDVDGNSWNNLWDQSFNQQKLLPWYISGQLKSTLFTQNSSNQFFMDLNRSLNSEKGEYLQNNFSEEIAMLWVFKGEIDEAQKYLQIYINNFLDYWQQLDSSYSSLRYHKLLKLCNVIDINKFVNTMHNLNVSTKEHINELTNYWNRTVHGILPSILFTEEKVLYRKQFLNVITNKLQSTEDDELKDILSDLTKVQFRLNEQIIDAAIEQNNFYMTKKYLNIHKNHNSPKVKLGLSKLASIKAVMLDSPTSKLDVLLQGCKVLEQIFQDPNQTLLKLLAHVQLFNQYSQISSLLKLNDEIFQNRKSDLKNLTETSSISSPEEIALFAANKLKLYLRSFDEKLDHEMETEDGNQNAEKCAKVANAYVELAYFARKQEHYDDFTLFVLRAMKYNSSEGRQLFPCVLMETEFSEHQKTRFIEETEKNTCVDVFGVGSSNTSEC
jgi:DNA-dependent protein kinase catalytic subunit